MNKTTRIVAAVSLLVVCSVVGYIVGIKDAIAVKVLLDEFQQLSSQQVSQLELLGKELQLKQIELQTERAKSSALLNDLEKQAVIAAETEAKLSLFRKVMTPEKEAGGVEINSVYLTPLAQNNRFRLNVALLQVDRTKPLAKGSLSVAISGLQKATPITVKHSDLIEAKSKKLKFNFRYLTEIETVIILPEGLEADSLDLKLNFSRAGYRGKSIIKQSYDWKSILKTP